MALSFNNVGREMIWMIRGLSFVLAGLMGSVVSFLLEQFSLFSARQGVHLMILPLCGLSIWFGAACLRAIPPEGVAWRSAVERCFWSAIVLSFLSPFVFFWRVCPHQDYLTFNLGLVIVGIVVHMCALNELLHCVAEVLEDTALIVTAQLSRTVCYLLLIIPISVCLGGVCRDAFGFGTERMSFLGSLNQTMRELPRWAMAIPMVPVCVTAALLWTIKAVCLARLEAMTDGLDGAAAQDWPVRQPVVPNKPAATADELPKTGNHD